MSESIPVSDEIKTQLYERWTERAKEAWEEYDRGETLTETEIMKKYSLHNV